MTVFAQFTRESLYECLAQKIVEKSNNITERTFIEKKAKEIIDLWVQCDILNKELINAQSRLETEPTIRIYLLDRISVDSMALSNTDRKLEEYIQEIIK